jgi:carbon-monoxide dehydrogenase small subunit
MQVTVTVNGERYTREIEPRRLLVHFLRDDLGLTGTHWGCDTSNCGVCVVQVDGTPVKSCTMLAAMASGHEVRTVEGLEQNGELDPIQQGFMSEHGLQCGENIVRAIRWAADHPRVAETEEVAAP